MAISFVNALVETSTGSRSLDCTGSDFLVMVCANNSTDTAITAPTYAGVTMTKVLTYTVNNGTRQNFWVLHAPATGSNTLAPGTTTHYSAACYLGVAQADSVEASNSVQKSGSGNQTVTVTTGFTGEWLLCTKWDQTVAADSVVNGVVRGGTDITTHDYVIVDSNGSVGTAGTHTIGFHYSGSEDGYLGAIALKPGPYILTATKGTFSLTGFASTFLRAHNYVLTAVTGVFSFTGFVAALVGSLWTRLTRHTSTETNNSKSSSSWTDQTKNTGSETNQPKS